jgi:hypothetical protein
MKRKSSAVCRLAQCILPVVGTFLIACSSNAATGDAATGDRCRPVQGAGGKTFYVDASAADDSGDGTKSKPKKYIGSGVALLSPTGGDTLIIAAGTYSNALDAITSVPTGTLTAWNVIKAAVDGTVVITAALQLPLGNHFTQFEGLKWDSPTEKDVFGNYVKFLRCGFKGGPNQGNAMNLGIGTNNATPGAKFILVEDSWAYGSGGRYQILVYNSDSVILRRVVVRHDGGWTDPGGTLNPEAGIVTYDSINVRLQDVVVIDSLTGLVNWQAGMYNVGNTSTTQIPTNVKIQGAIVLNNQGNGIEFDGAIAYVSSSVDDAVVWEAPTQFGDGFVSNGAAHQVTVNRMSAKTGAKGYADYFAGTGVITVKNSIAYQNTTRAVLNIATVTDLVSWQNGTDFGTVLNPTTNGLKYLTRIEDGSRLTTLGEGRSQIGPRIVKRIGASCTLYGEAGFEDVTTQDLWPWPNEGRMKSDFAEVNSRGFSAGSGSLTDYIWGYLGNASPIANR